MTLNEDEKLNICEILAVDSFVLDRKLTVYLNQITPARETRIRAQIERWNGGVGDDFSSIEANAKNFGFSEDSEDARDDVRQILATLLFFSPDELGQGGSTNSFTIERG